MNKISQTFLLLTGLAFALPACVVGAAAGPAEPTAALASEGAPYSEAALPTSGGLTIEAPEVITLGTPLVGTLKDGEHRYYQFSVSAGQEETFLFYSKLVKDSLGGCNIEMELTDELGRNLGSALGIAADEHYEKEGFTKVFEKDQTVTMTVSTRNLGHGIVQYKVATAAR